MTRPVTACNVLIDACWTSINNSSKSPRTKTEERLAGQSVRVRRTFGRGMGLNFGGISRLDSDEQLVPFLVLARFCRTSTGEVLIEQFHI